MAKKLTQKDLEELRSSLMSARQALAGDISQLETEALEPAGDPAAVEADAGAHFQEFNLELLERDGSALREVDEALDRLDEGVYGRCESCQVWIPKSRLKAVPYARHCIECQRNVESQSF
jgi:RNA polymerase-binding protein DksA